MANINLLPWREELREEKKKEFFTWMIAAALFAALCVFAWYSLLEKTISNQNEQNQFLQVEIDKLAAKAKVLEELKKSRDILLQRVAIIQELQGKRPKIVHVFDELTSLVPKGTFLTQIVRTDDRLDIQGTAESNNDVSDFMRQLDRSDWFAEPVLLLVKANETVGDQANDFQLRVKISDLNAQQANSSVVDDEIPQQGGVGLNGSDAAPDTNPSVGSVMNAGEDAQLKAQLNAEIEAKKRASAQQAQMEEQRVSVQQQNENVVQESVLEVEAQPSVSDSQTQVVTEPQVQSPLVSQEGNANGQ